MCLCGPDRAPCAGQIAVTGGSRCGGTGRSGRDLWRPSVRTGAAVYLRSSDRRGSVSPQTGPARQCISAVRTSTAVYLFVCVLFVLVTQQSLLSEHGTCLLNKHGDDDDDDDIRSPDRHDSVAPGQFGQVVPARTGLAAAVKTTSSAQIRHGLLRFGRTQ